MVSTLDRKLLRDLRRMSGQMLTIALVVASGIAAFITMKGNYSSLERARIAYYQQYRLADVFANLERAPESVRKELEAIEGVARVQTRVVRAATVPLADVSTPIKARVVSLDGEAPLNAIHLREGRMVEASREDEALLLQVFADAHNIRPGDSINAVINGRMREVRIVGIAMSPEYVMAVLPGDASPDPSRFAVLWMGRDALSAAFNMKGAFNDVALQLQPGASEAAVITATDRVLERYGSVGAYGQALQPSNRFVDGELVQLEAMAGFLPLIFLGVAALLLNIVLSRLVHLQRPEIATLKAVGYRDIEVGLHFLKLVLVIAFVGSCIGIALGSWLGSAMLELYAEWFRFPNLRFRLDGRDVLEAVGISFGAAVLGAFSAVRRVVLLPPAEAMRPAAPAKYRRSILDRLRLGLLVGAATTMIVRELERRPLRALMSVLSIAASVGLMVVGGWYYDGIYHLIYTQFHEVMREDVSVTFISPRPERSIRELRKLPGVLGAEGLRIVPVRFRSGHHHRDAGIVGYADDMELRGLRDRNGRPVALPPDGVVLTDILAEILEVEVGDTIEVDIHEGQRGHRSLRVSGLIDEAFGMQGHMRLKPMQRWLGEERVTSMALLRVDPHKSALLDARLKELPYVASVTRRNDILERFREQSGNMIITMALIISLFAATITVGVVYNNARVALSLRSRDLASLRVLGFRRSEISAILLGELGIQVLAALPLGLLFGNWLIDAIASTIDPEQWRMPILITSRTYVFAIVVALAASALSALLVRRKLDKLDLIAVLKTRE